jgi:hypothetical protein
MATEQAFLEQLEGFERDMKWLSQHYDRLKEQYPDQYVAVLAYSVVDHDSDLKSLVARLDEKYQADSGRIAIKYVTTKRVELIL